MKKSIVFMMVMLLIAGCAKEQVANSVDSVEKTPTIGPDDQVIFEEVSTPERGDYIKIRKVVRISEDHSRYTPVGKPVAIPIGWISIGKDGVYRYYEPETIKSSEVDPFFADTDLDDLKFKIRSKRSGCSW